RFLVQWAASERRRDSVVPVAFWWLSLLGGMTLLVYAVNRRDPVIITGQAMGIIIYVRNLMLVAKGRRRAGKRAKTQVIEEIVEEAPRPHTVIVRERRRVVR